MPDLFFEDLSPGQVFDGGVIEVSDDDVRSACRLFRDFAPLHVDAEYARSRGFRAPIAHGLLTAGWATGPLARLVGGTIVTHLEDSIRYLAPVFVGDTLSIRISVRDKVPRSRFGLVHYTHEVMNQDGVLVLEAVTLLGHAYRTTSQKASPVATP